MIKMLDIFRLGLLNYVSSYEFVCFVRQTAAASATQYAKAFDLIK